MRLLSSLRSSLAPFILLLHLALLPLASGQEENDRKEETPTEEVEESEDFDDTINKAVAPYTKAISDIVFFSVYEDTVGEGEEAVQVSVPFILIWLVGAALFFTFFFKFINIRGFALSLKTIRNRYSREDDPGQISHFEALTAAVSGTVGLGNIAGAAIAISVGGPGAAFWMVTMGLLGMSTKFAECTLGVNFREIDKNGEVYGGPMHYLTRGMASRGLGGLGRVLAIVFSVCVIGASFGAGNMFQANQATSQIVEATGGGLTDYRWVVGVIIAITVGLVIIGGISRIAKITSKLVPTMAIVYVVSCLIIIFSHYTEIIPSIGLIFSSAFSGEAIAGGFIGTFLQGLQRGSFSNEAGIGSAPIAHSAVKTRFAASEGLVALLEPFIDTVIVCSMTAMVVIITGEYKNVDAEGIKLTSSSFESVIPGFSIVLSVAVVLFALSTLITWSYYGLQGWKYLFGHSKPVDLLFKFIFCVVVVLGAAMSTGKVVEFSDAMLFSMSFANLIGVYCLLPVVRKELKKYQDYTKRVDNGEDLEKARAAVESD